ncbi:MAG: DUF1499 domain-containing protein [Pseudomonadota bacterium]
MRSAVFVIALAVFLFTAAFTIRELIYTWLFGRPDLGASSLETLARPSSPNTYLLANEGSTSAKPDAPAVLLKTTPQAALDAATKQLSDLAETRRVDDSTNERYRRFVVRTQIMRYPDTVEFWAAPAPGQRGKIAFSAYSRSQIGYSDLGANKARIDAVAASLKSAFEAT